MMLLVALLGGILLGAVLAGVIALYVIAPIKAERDALRDAVETWIAADAHIPEYTNKDDWQRVQLPRHHRLERAETALRALRRVSRGGTD